MSGKIDGKGVQKSAGKNNSNKVEGGKVLAHQFSEPAVRGDISLVHFVNKEIVCRESGWVQLIRTEGKKKHAKMRKSAQSFFIKSFPVPNYRHYCGYWRDEREGGCPYSILSPYQSSTLHLLPPADVASPAHVSLSRSGSRKSCRSFFLPPAQKQKRSKGNHPRNDSCHSP